MLPVQGHGSSCAVLHAEGQACILRCARKKTLSGVPATFVQGTALTISTQPTAPMLSQATVAHVDKQRHALDVSLLSNAAAAAAAVQLPAAGSVVLGRVTAVGGAGVRVQLSAQTGGRVALTDIHDASVQQALAGLRTGQYCHAAVLGPDPAARRSRRGPSSGDEEGGGSQLLLSLRPSAGGQCGAHAAAMQQADAPAVADGPLQPGQLKQGQQVAGYVKTAGTAGVFVCLARNLDARIRWVMECRGAGAGLGEKEPFERSARRPAWRPTAKCPLSTPRTNGWRSQGSD